MKKLLFILWVASLVAVAANAQVVSPLQAGHYFPGMINVRDMTNPPPGMTFVLYNVYMWSDTYVDRGGRKIKNIDLGSINPDFPDVTVDFDLQAFTIAPLIMWASPFKVLGATWSPYVILPTFTSSDSRVFAETGPGVIDPPVSGEVSSTVSGFGDLFVQPLGLSWTFEHFDVMATWGFYAPTGPYTTGGSDNIGLGYWTHQFQGFGYYYPSPSRATAFMLGLTYEINGDITDRHVQPGDRLSLEWGVSQYVSERLELTIQGSENRQVTDDRGSDVWWDPSVHDRKSSLFIAVNYWAVANKLYLGLKYGFDYAMRQRFENRMLLLNVIYVPGILNGK